MTIVVAIQIAKQGVRIDPSSQIGGWIAKRELSARYGVVGRMGARSAVARTQTLGRDGDVYRRGDAMISQRADHQQEPVAVVLLVRSIHVVDLTLDPEDVR